MLPDTGRCRAPQRWRAPPHSIVFGRASSPAVMCAVARYAPRRSSVSTSPVFVFTLPSLPCLPSLPPLFPLSHREERKRERIFHTHFGACGPCAFPPQRHVSQAQSRCHQACLVLMGIVTSARSANCLSCRSMSITRLQASSHGALCVLVSAARTRAAIQITTLVCKCALIVSPP